MESLSKGGNLIEQNFEVSQAPALDLRRLSHTHTHTAFKRSDMGVSVQPFL